MDEDFPKLASLLAGAVELHGKHCTVLTVDGGLKFSKFSNPYPGALSTESLTKVFRGLGPEHILPLTECFNAFDKGPIRTIMFIRMLNDLSSGRLSPNLLTAENFATMYEGLAGFYQTPKVIALYAQQCFGNESALPIDRWIDAMLKWPLQVYSSRSCAVKDVFAHSNKLGKVERLLWISAQARKVHSSLCDNALWCIKFDSKRAEEGRGPGPLACLACSLSESCPSFESIAGRSIVFNGARRHGGFRIVASAGNNSTKNQRFDLTVGANWYDESHDDFTPIDAPSAFKPYPAAPHRGEELTVAEFVRRYRSASR
jgi:hypothetical protein